MKVSSVESILDSNFKDEYYEESDVLIIFDEGFLLDISENISLYREFTFPFDDLHSNLKGAYEQLCLIQGIYNLTNKAPTIEEDFYYGCPFDGNKVGFFNINPKKELIELVQAFKAAMLCREFDVDEIKQIAANEYEFYISLVRECSTDFNVLLNKGWKSYQGSDDNILDEMVCTIINREGSVLVTSLFEFPSEIVSNLNLSEFKAIDPYIGDIYTIFKNEEGCVFWQSNLVKEVISFMRILGLLEENDLYFYEAANGILEIVCGVYKSVVMPFKVTDTDPINYEYDMYKKIGKIFSEHKKCTLKAIDLKALKPDEFERVCMDLLYKQGFKNIVSRGNTNTPDGGIDIEADEEVQRITGITNKHWIFQCKQMKKQIDRKDVAEIPYLLDEFDADGYGVFYSGCFTPSTIDRFKSVKKDRRDKDILYWDGKAISRFIRNDKSGSLL